MNKLTRKALNSLRAGGLEEAKMLVKEGWYVIEMGKHSITWVNLTGHGKYVQLFVL